MKIFKTVAGILISVTILSLASPKERVLAADYWVGSGSNAYSSVSGNIGIGTTVPVGKLQIALPAWTSRDIDSQHTIIGSGVSGHGIRFGYNETGNIGSINILKPGLAWGNLILQDNGGNVGIGTTSPSTKLDVNGDIKVGGVIRGDSEGNVIVKLGN